MNKLDVLQMEYRAADLEIGNWLTLWQEIADYVTPWRNRILTKVASGEKLTDRVFNSTPIQAAVTAASSIHGSVTPNGVRWFSIYPSDRSLRQFPGVPEWLDFVSEAIHTAIQNSNFDSEIQEIYNDLLVIGTGCLGVEEALPSGNGAIGFGGIRFHAHSPGSYKLREGVDGRVTSVYWEKETTVGALALRWGYDALSEDARKLLDAHRIDAPAKLLRVVRPKDEVYDDPLTGRRKPVESFWIEMEPGNRKEWNILEEGSHGTMPIMTPRWRKLAGETYGRSPAMNELPNIRTLNQAVELRLKAWTLAIAPPLVTPDKGVIGNIRLEPFARIYVRPGSRIEALQIPARFDVANFNEEKLEASIRAGFYVDLLQPQSRQGTPLSATEINVQFTATQRIVGPVLSRLQEELIAPVIRRVYDILDEAGQIPPPPEILSQAGASLNLDFEGPVARVQRTTQLEALNTFFSQVFPIAEVSRDILDRINFDGVVDVMAEATTVPQRILVSLADAQQVRQQRAQQEAQAAQMTNVLEAARVVQDGQTGLEQPGEV